MHWQVRNTPGNALKRRNFREPYLPCAFGNLVRGVTKIDLSKADLMAISQILAALK
jgi:hypothetical protein